MAYVGDAAFDLRSLLTAAAQQPIVKDRAGRLVRQLGREAARQPLVRQAVAEFIRTEATQPEVQQAAASAAGSAASDFLVANKGKLLVGAVLVGAFLGRRKLRRLLRR